MKKEELKQLFPGIADKQIAQFSQFADVLRDWNQRINLISRQDVDNLWTHHFLPSIIPSTFIDLPAQCWVMDIGSGGGFPAIPLKILYPQWQLLMVESIRKKSAFLENAIQTLQLPHATVVNDRVEMLGKRGEFHHKFDLVTVRAVAAIPKLIEWGTPYLRRTGRFLLWKGTSDLPEMQATASKLRLKFRVHQVPEALQSLSPKLSALCWFEIWRGR